MRRLAPLGLLLALLGGCSFFRSIGFAPTEPDRASVAGEALAEEPAHVKVQHVLLSFEGAGVPGATRTREEARALAERVLAQAREGRDFDELVRLYSDDRDPRGVVAIANWGIPPAPDEVERRTMVRGFSAVAFALAKGEIALVEHDANASPFGWHVVKRVE